MTSAARNSSKRVWEWKQQSGSTITNQVRRLGASIDWSREYFTMDDKMSPAVLDVFVTLYKQGLIYRGKRLVNWDPVLRHRRLRPRSGQRRRRRQPVAHPVSARRTARAI